MPESKVSDSSEAAIVPRKRGRPPKSKDSLLNCTLDDNELENATGEFIELQENDIPQESKTSSMNNVLNDKKFDGTSEKLSTPRKKGRPPKLSSQNTIPDDENVDISAELVTPCKRGRGRPRKSNPSSLTIPPGDKIASENIDTIQTKSDPSNSMSLSQNSISNDQNIIDLTEESPKRGRGRPRKLKSSLNISSIVDTSGDAPRETDIVEISNSSWKLMSSPQTPTSSDKKFDNVSEKSITAQKRSRPSKQKSSSLNSTFTDKKSVNTSVDTAKRRNKLPKSKSSPFNFSNNDKTSNIALVESPISGKMVKQPSKQLKLDFSTVTKSPKNTYFSPEVDNKNSESETGELKFYPIFTSPSSFNKSKNINQETKLNVSNSKILTNSNLNENEIEFVKTDENISLNDPLAATDIDSAKISDLNNSIDHDIELSVCDVQQVCSNVQEDSGSDSVNVVDQINVSDRKPKNSKVKLKQKNENKQETLVQINSDVLNTKISSEDKPGNIENESDCSVINDTPNRHLLEVEITNSPKVEGGSENVKEKIKLSLIFTSNEALSVQVNTVNHSNKKISNSDSQLRMNKTVISRKSETVTLNNSSATIEIEVLKESEPCESDMSKKSETVVPRDSSTLGEIKVIKGTELRKSDVSKNSETVILNDSSTLMEIDVSEETELCEANDMDPHVSDSVQEVCLKAQKSVDCDIEISGNIDQKDISNEHTNNLNLEVSESVDCDIIETIAISNESTKDVNLESNSDSTPKLKQKKKMKKTKSDKTNRKSEVVESASDTEGSNRRRSLRCRGARDVFLDYSEVDCDVDSSESSKSDKHRTSKSAKGKNNGNLSKHSLEVDYIDLSKVQGKSKNKKENDKLFPIFKSNKASSDEINVSSPSNKRKSLCDVVLVDNNTSEKYHKVKKARSQVNNLSENGSLNSQDAFNCSEECNKETDNFIDLEAVKDFSKQTENDSIIVSKKSYKIDTEIICFPKLSHVNIYTETQPEKINNFQIVADEVDCDIIAPLWNENESIIDVNCAEAIKSLETDSHIHKELENNLIEASSSMIKSNENDVLWTDSIQNTVSKGKENEDLVNEVKSWLLQWRNRFSKSSKPRRHSHSSDSDSYSSDSDSDDDFISNSIILYGMSGSGKTSLVFSLADELGFTVLEVNASSHRSGRNISHQLKEALESYHMEGIKIEDALENSKSETKKQTKRKRLSDEPENSQAKNIKSFFEVGSKETEKKNKSKKNIASFFVADDSKKDKNKGKNKKAKESGRKNDSAENSNDYFEKINSDKKSCRISSSTIILFDDVDIVFEEDEGFWSTVKGFLKISKKPVIFTVSRNLPIVKNIINADIQIFNMMPASKDTALETLKTCCKMYSRENTNIDLELLTFPSPTDLRRSILNTQFWSKMAKIFDDSSSSVLNNSHEDHSKLVCFNNFIAGDLNFSAKYVKELLFNHLPNYSLNTVSDYHRLGYDVLFNNYFSILDILDSIKHEKVWKAISDQNSCNVTKSFSDSQMWQEACEIFKQKKKALKSGSCSKDLFVISDMVDDFSFADMLKGLSPNKNQCISMSERIKLWTAGLPICNDHVLLSYEDILQIISMIHIYALRKAQNKFVSDKISDDSILILEHPFTVYDQTFSSKTENDLVCISEALPASQQMNKTALALDYLSMIKNICKDEESRQTNSGKRSGRFLHYFDSISFLIDRKAF